MYNSNDIIKKIKNIKESIIPFSNVPNEKFINFEFSGSAFDPLGCILSKDGKIYRGVYKKSEEHFKELYNTGILQTFAEVGIMPHFNLTNYYTEDFPIIFEIEKVDIIPSIFWSFSMLKAEAKLKILLIEILNKFGYTLIDGHSLNTTFKNGKPIFIDFGSIIKGTKTDAFSEIYMYNVIPLIMLILGDYSTARAVHLGIPPYKLTIPQILYRKSFEVKSAIRRYTNLKNFTIMHKIRKIKPITLKEFDSLFPKGCYLKKSDWGNYYSYLTDIENNPRFMRVVDKIKQYASDRNTFLDLAGNSGVFSNIVSKNFNFSRIISSDYDEMAIENGIENYGDTDINFLLLNFALQNNPAIDTIKSDIVCALAVTHHLLLTQKINIDYLFKKIKQYTNKYLFIEFCPLGMYSLENPNLLPDVPEWYTESWFEEHFKKYFKLLDKEVIATTSINGKEYPHRILFTGQCS